MLSATPVAGVLLVDSARTTPATVTLDGAEHTVDPRGAWLAEFASDSDLRVDGERVDLSVLTRAAVPARLRLRGRVPVPVERHLDRRPGLVARRRPAAPRLPRRALLPRRRRGGAGPGRTADRPGDPRHGIRDRRDPGHALSLARDHRRAHPRPPLRRRGQRLVRRRPARPPQLGGRRGGRPAEAAVMQHGEDLHVLNLVAGNVAGRRVYDQEALHHWAGRDLPWSDAGHVARMGVEYRNDLLGHVHAFGLTAPPSTYHTGFLDDADWPPNGAACGELRELQAVLGYAPPVPRPGQHPRGRRRRGPARLQRPRPGRRRRARPGRRPRTAALLGLLRHRRGLPPPARRGQPPGRAGGDRLDAVVHPTGHRLQPARVGTRVRASRRPSPPRAYAHAVRQGRTFVTTGPWLEMTAGEREIGDTWCLAAGDEVEVVVPQRRPRGRTPGDPHRRGPGRHRPGR